MQSLAAGGQLISFGWEARRDEPGREGTLQHAERNRTLIPGFLSWSQLPESPGTPGAFFLRFYVSEGTERGSKCGVGQLVMTLHTRCVVTSRGSSVVGL